MIRGLRICNQFDQSVVIRTDFPYSEMVTSSQIGNASVEQGPFLLYSIDGLDPGEANITTTEIATTDGAVFNSARKTSKELTFTFLLKETGSPYQASVTAANGETIQSAKDKVRKYFPLKSKIKIVFCQDNNPIQYAADFKKYIYYMCEAYVKSISYDTFSKMCAASITILMPDPYFYFFNTLDNFNILTVPMPYSLISPNVDEKASSIYNPYSLSYGIDHVSLVSAEQFYNDSGEHIFYNVIIPITNNVTTSALETDKYQIFIGGKYKTLGSTYRVERSNSLCLDLSRILAYSEFSSRGLINGDVITVSSQFGKKDIGIRLANSTTDISINSVLTVLGNWPYLEENINDVYANINLVTQENFFYPLSSTINNSGFSIKYNYKRSGL